ALSILPRLEARVTGGELPCAAGAELRCQQIGGGSLKRMEESSGHGCENCLPTAQTQERVQQRVLDVEDRSLLRCERLRRERLDRYRWIRAWQLNAQRGPRSLTAVSLGRAPELSAQAPPH